MSIITFSKRVTKNFTILTTKSKGKVISIVKEPEYGDKEVEIRRCYCGNKIDCKVKLNNGDTFSMQCPTCFSYITVS